MMIQNKKITTPYAKKDILKSLFLAPIPLLLILFTLFVGLNQSKHSVTWAQIPSIVFLMLIVWGAYCLLVIPLAYPISVKLQQNNYLNLWVILLTSLVMGFIVMMIIQLTFIYSYSWMDFKNLIIHNEYYSLPLFTGFCYWGLLKFMGKRQIHKTPILPD
ncbi:hypothetical protein [Acinetobacter sp. MD2(2019)]|uniref:hypothetical protein n=1 Tax=Acinetobacter sp. MD2(2019) TaxID=2605273 RepID=UPI002D1EDDB7|nr:hypothetical protein [Acinetobacter sp. MD2(2019)]MEB3753093.1 hypothetical protein [Acinetobacter sp. MD2(2019)]